ncbi:hypothetical protein GFY24_39530 [Nocardia sp. SYP-A9097]|uniref:hypothetical protein n=1 Tax=Nocardia sp. SYP-A9097 TaxID=2663237 RepID=UPI00129BADD7|nr:hypothetical protein [Nocardia sp. SYP-A9097]MRH93434.1 hypothetical protein [Nocardia sp. SYP-A9097]
MATESTQTEAAESTNGKGEARIEELIRQGVPREEIDPVYAVSDVEAQQIAAEELAQARRLEDELIAELPPADQEEFRQVQRELAALGYEVHAVAKWWGFEIHLNAEAAKLAADITEYIGKMVALIPAVAPFKPLIKLYCKLKAAWIKAVGESYGCKLVSPWIAPGMLIPISLAPRADTSLWWTVFEEGQGWSEDTRFPAHASESNPALAELGGELYCVHRGGGSDVNLWQAVYNPDTGWGTDTPFTRHASDQGPALAAFNNGLYLLHKGNAGDVNLWMTRRPGPNAAWTPDERLPRNATSVGPALAVFGDRLYCVHRGSGNDANLWWTSIDRNSGAWPGDTAIPGVEVPPEWWTGELRVSGGSRSK